MSDQVDRHFRLGRGQRTDAQAREAEQTKLEPCPFDVGQGLHGTKVNSNGGRMAMSDVWWVQCKCGAEGPNGRSPAEAETAWNRRTSSIGWEEGREAAAREVTVYNRRHGLANGIAEAIRALQPPQ